MWLFVVVRILLIKEKNTERKGDWTVRTQAHGPRQEFPFPFNLCSPFFCFLSPQLFFRRRHQP